MKTDAALRFLVLDQDPRFERSIMRLLKPHKVLISESIDEPRQVIASGGIDAVIVDAEMPDAQGLALLSYAKSVSPRCFRIMTLLGPVPDSKRMQLREVAHLICEKPLERRAIINSLAVFRGQDRWATETVVHQSH